RYGGMHKLLRTGEPAWTPIRPSSQPGLVELLARQTIVCAIRLLVPEHALSGVFLRACPPSRNACALRPPACSAALAYLRGSRGPPPAGKSAQPPFPSAAHVFALR